MILALETSSGLCAVCVLDGTTGEALAEISNDIGRGHAEQLMDDIENALRQAGIKYSDLTAIAAGVGPGSFTGIRVGVAAARGFALALKVPVYGVTSLQAIALQAAHEAHGAVILATLDAGRDEVYLQLFNENALPVEEARAVRIDDLPAAIPSRPVVICGSGSTIFALQPAAPQVSIHLPLIGTTASSVALAATNPAMRVAPKPLYLRAPDAKPQGAFAVARQ